MHNVKQALHQVINFIFPLYCLICNTLSKKLICHECYEKINFIKNPCIYCGYPLIKSNEINNNICAGCFNTPPIFSSAKSVMIYNENSKDIICKFKFSDKTHAVKLYSKWLLELGKNIFPIIDVIIPVPLHRWRLLSRGYNQSSLLANKISQETGIKADHFSLFKIKNTKPQSTTIIKRVSNIKNVFAVKNDKNIRGKNILLIDDVITTGATVYACTKTLLRNKVKSVHVLTIARTEKPLLKT
ncbi:MAG: ComF family protein [Rickettsiaceae bacterium H1]|nr:ComF family protein [Rickettsiaceae bacterium H1]